MDRSAPDSCDCLDPGTPALTRRGLLRAPLIAGGAAVTTAAFGSAYIETAYGDPTRSAPAVIVVLSMRGAVDGMSLVVPHGDPVYAQARPNIAVPKERLLAADGFFGLHPALAPLLPLWNSGSLAAVHATGLPVPNRSHFSAVEEVEDADPGSAVRVGWINRLIGRDNYTSPLQAVQVGDSVPPAALFGPQQTVAVEKIADTVMSGADKWDTQGRRPRSMHTMWNDARGPLGAGARAAMRAIDELAPVRATASAPQNGATYPDGDFGDVLAETARVIRGDVGAEVITIDYGSWDHHSDLGTLQWGRMQDMATELATGLAAFFTDLGPLAGKVTLLTMSEFGRRTRENANYGLDHGWGNVMLLMGAGVKGGYHGRWPGLTNTGDADLKVTTDYRSVLAELIGRRLGASTGQVFPGFTPEAVGALA